MSDPKIVNVSELPWTSWSSGERLAVEIRDPARRLGSVQSGFRLYRGRELMKGWYEAGR